MSMKPIPTDAGELTNELLDEHLDGMLRLAYRREAERKIEEIIEDSKRPFTPEEDAQLELAYRQFLVKYEEHLRAQKKARRRARIRRAVRRAIRVVSCLILILAVIIPVALPYAVAKNERVRSAVLEMLIEHGDGNVTLSMREVQDEEFDVPADWKGEYFPAYIPEGYKICLISQYTAIIEFKNSDGLNISFNELTENTYVSTDSENSVVTNELINGATATILRKAQPDYKGTPRPDWYTVIWQKDDKYFMLWTSEPLEETLKIARSVRKIVPPYPYVKPLDEQTDAGGQP
ncbi:MAG: DUF4367 domain-containing protein [Clostridia bacterium]|nr:DUF4367 domain-containing protein [Clostridia bacterium]